MRQAITQMKVEGLFLDYDGTISSINVSREESIVSKELEAILHRIEQKIPIGVITTKDLPFILPRTPFARAWCGIAGLEMKIGDRVVKAAGVEAALPQISLALKYARQWVGDSIYIEEKRDLMGQTLAFCLDWRHSRDLKEAETIADKVVDYCQTLRLEVVKYEGQPFVDVYSCRVDKGKAVAELKQCFGLQSGVIYMGDAKVDNPAFRVADIGIGVLHEESAGELSCDCYVKFEDVASLLQRLIENDLVFYEAFPEIISKRRQGR